jgi:hypothetical protein
MAATHRLNHLKQAVWDSLILEKPPHIAAENNEVDEDELNMALTAIKSGKIAPEWDMPHFIKLNMPDLMQPESETVPAILPPTILQIVGFTFQLPQQHYEPSTYFNPGSLPETRFLSEVHIGLLDRSDESDHLSS